MPPIMGAAAFLMAEYMNVTYGQVTLWAILPAVLYFGGIFISVHLEAKKLGLRGIPRSELPRFKYLMRNVYLLLPLVFLIWVVTANIRSLQYAASIAILISIAVSLVGTIRDAAAEAKETKTGSAAGIAVKKTGLMILEALEAGGKGSITVAVACSMAGMIAGCITVTGLASKLISGVVALSSKIPNPTLSLLLALFLTMLCCIVLGMGVPTTANYCIMASTCAPILITLGIPKIAAHFFVFYFGIVADITPPVALAAYAGSAIAKSDPMKTGINATKLAIAAFIVPYMFAMNPSMLLMDQGVLAAVQVIITSCLGIFGIAAALEGYVVTRAPWWQRILLAAGRPVPDRPQAYDRPCRYRGDRDRRCAADRHAQARQARRRIKNPEPFSQEHVRYFWRASFCTPCAAPRGALHVPADGVYYLYTRHGKEQSA